MLLAVPQLPLFVPQLLLLLVVPLSYLFILVALRPQLFIAEHHLQLLPAVPCPWNLSAGISPQVLSVRTFLLHPFGPVASGSY